MRDADRFRLLGTYRTPRVRMGTVLSCEARDGDVIVTGYSDAKIAWPVGRRRGSSTRGLVLYGALAAAVRRESNQAVGHWFGVSHPTVTRWRQALGVGRSNPGTHRLKSDYTREPWAKRARKKAWAKAGDPERRRKIAQAKRGKRRPPHVVEAVRRAHLGMRHTPEARAKVAAAMRERAKVFLPCGRAWTAEEDGWVKTLPAPEVAKRTERSLDSVYTRRRLGVRDGRRR